MKILLIENSFSGAHGSFQKFLSEIEHALEKLGHRVFRAGDVQDVAAVYKQQEPNFSLGIGKYKSLINGKLICDVYEIPHYQWIVDNPLKMPQYSSENFTPIFIDREFVELYEPKPKHFLWFPLGIAGDENNYNKSRERGIVFAGQVKNLNSLQAEIRRSNQHKLIEKFLSDLLQNLDDSFIVRYKSFLLNNEIVDLEEFFRLTNSYLRCFKRLNVLKKIRQWPLILAGNIAEESLLRKPNVIHLGDVPYSDLHKLFSKYTHVLHISPNFSACVHDRILRGLVAGCQVIAEENSVLRAIFGDELIYFRYKNFDEQSFEIGKGNRGLRTTAKILERFEWKNILTAVIDDYRKRVDNVE